VQYVTSVNVSPYLWNGTGETVVVCVAVGCGVVVGKVCPKEKEQDKTGNAKAIINRNTLVIKELLISLLLTLCGQDFSTFPIPRSQPRLHLHSSIRPHLPACP